MATRAEQSSIRQVYGDGNGTVDASRLCGKVGSEDCHLSLLPPAARDHGRCLSREEVEEELKVVLHDVASMRSPSMMGWDFVLMMQ